MKRFLQEFFPPFSLRNFFKEEGLMIFSLSFFKYGILLLTAVVCYYVDPVFTNGLLQKSEATAIDTGSPTILEFFILILVVAIAAPLWEELIFRGIFLRVLQIYLRPLLGIIIVALIHGLLHGYLHSLSSFIASFFYGFIFVKYRNFLASTIAHGINNGFIVLLAAIIGAGGDDSSSSYDFISTNPQLALILSLTLVIIPLPFLIKYIVKNKSVLKPLPALE